MANQQKIVHVNTKASGIGQTSVGEKCIHFSGRANELTIGDARNEIKYKAIVLIGWCFGECRG